LRGFGLTLSVAAAYYRVSHRPQLIQAQNEKIISALKSSVKEIARAVLPPPKFS